MIIMVYCVLLSFMVVIFDNFVGLAGIILLFRKKCIKILVSFEKLHIIYLFFILLQFPKYFIEVVDFLCKQYVELLEIK
jgi:hypothetical protein